MSATETKFSSREIVDLISETKLGEFGCLMANAVKGGYNAADVAMGIESNFAATLLLFVDNLPEDRRQQTCIDITENVRDWTVKYLKRLSDANAILGDRQPNREAPSPATAK